MKWKIFIVLFQVVFLLAIPPQSACFDGIQSIQIANGDWPPYFSPTLKHNGVASRIVKEAFREAGISVEYVFRPWKRGLLEAQDGKWAGTVGWIRTKEREEHFFISDPIMDITPVFFQRKDNRIDWVSIMDLKGRSILD